MSGDYKLYLERLNTGGTKLTSGRGRVLLIRKIGVISQSEARAESGRLLRLQERTSHHVTT